MFTTAMVKTPCKNMVNGISTAGLGLRLLLLVEDLVQLVRQILNVGVGHFHFGNGGALANGVQDDFTREQPVKGVDLPLVGEHLAQRARDLQPSAHRAKRLSIQTKR